MRYAHFVRSSVHHLLAAGAVFAVIASNETSAQYRADTQPPPVPEPRPVAQETRDAYTDVPVDMYTRDDFGRLTSVTTAEGTTSYRYFEDIDDPLIQEVAYPNGSKDTYDLKVARAAYDALATPPVSILALASSTSTSSDLCGTSGNRFGFNGYRYDCETGLYLTPSGRMYDPAVGRFLQQDSYLGDITNPRSLHRYMFGYANPTRYTDPSGHDPTLEYDFQTDQCARNPAACQRNTIDLTTESAQARLHGAGRATGGGLVALAGALAAPESGGFTLAAVGLGADQFFTGLKELFTGERQQSMLASAGESNAKVRGLSDADAKRSGGALEALALLITAVSGEVAAVDSVAATSTTADVLNSGRVRSIPTLFGRSGLVPAGQALRDGVSFTVMEDGALPLGSSRAASFPSGIDPTEGARLTESIRRSLGIEARNIAIAEANINGERDLLTSVSGKASPSGTVPSPTNRLFTWRDSGAQTRAFDSEVKILEDLGHRLPRDARGTVSLFTERPPCTSCGGSPTFVGVIEQFERRFPGVEVIVTHGE